MADLAPKELLPTTQPEVGIQNSREFVQVGKEYTQIQEDDTPVIVVNPAHGNEPYILGTAIAREVSEQLTKKGMKKAKIVVPLMYGERQRRILLEEHKDDPNLIYFDEEYGKILSNILFSSGNYADHLKQLTKHYDEVDRLLKQRFAVDASQINARSLATGEITPLSPKNIIATVDTSASVLVTAPKRYFAFPVLLSEILREAQKEGGMGFNETDMKKVISRMMELESAYAQVFIPKINSLSFKYADNLSEQPDIIDGRQRRYTPAMKAELTPTEGQVDKAGIYVMFSGTGETKEQNEGLVKAAKDAGIEVYTPPWEEVKDSVKAPPEVLSDKNILAVFGRSGWGTGWQVQNLAKPWLVTPYKEGDDPEIYFNNKTIEALKMGRVLKGRRITPAELTNFIQEISPGIQTLNTKLREEFGTLNGIRYVAEHIANDLTRSRS